MYQILLFGGVFLFSREIIEKRGPGILLSPVLVWLTTALLLLLIASALVCYAGLGEAALGYLSSLISFIAAAAAGSRFTRSVGKPAVLSSMLLATVLTILLLTVGYLIRGKNLDSSGILSVVTFTYAGCLLGAVLSAGREHSERSGQQLLRRQHSAVRPQKRK